jgi:hypothetical protein
MQVVRQALAGTRRGHAVPGYRTLIEPESFAAGLGHDEASPGGFVERLDGSKIFHGKNVLNGETFLIERLVPCKRNID